VQRRLIVSAAGTVTNFATISGTRGAGVGLGLGGSVDNTGTGLIEGGIFITSAAGTVTNSGTILSTNNGVQLLAGGTVVDCATISAPFGTAALFGGSGANLLALASGYHLVGTVQGSTAGTDTLALLGTAGSPVTVDYNALGLTSFENVLFGTGGNATLVVSNASTAGVTLGVTISGFDQASEVIDLTGIGNNGTISNFDTTNDLITVTGSTGSVTLQFDSIDTLSFTTTRDGGGTDLGIAPCYCRGTHILTDKGEMAVEDLAIGDRVVILSGKARPIRWIGQRAYDGRFVAGNTAVLPICIGAGALADGVPMCDLWVSLGHALYIDGVLVPAEQLVNGATIIQETAVDGLEYFHIELDTHDILFAEGAPAESYIDCDNRLMFANGSTIPRRPAALGLLRAAAGVGVAGAVGDPHPAARKRDGARPCPRHRPRPASHRRRGERAARRRRRRPLPLRHPGQQQCCIDRLALDGAGRGRRRRATCGDWACRSSVLCSATANCRSRSGTTTPGWPTASTTTNPPTAGPTAWHACPKRGSAPFPTNSPLKCT
jgi:Hint domain